MQAWAPLWPYGVVLTIITELGNTNGNIKAIYQKSKFLQNTSELEAGSAFGLLLDQTNFYAESGGQENDTGSITIDGEADFEVTDVQVYNGYVLHIGQLKEGELKVGDEVICTYDEVSFRGQDVLVAA